MAEKPFFNIDDTTPRAVRWLQSEGGFVVACFPFQGGVALILIGVEENAESVAPAISLAKQCGCPPKIERTYIYHRDEWTNAPVTHVLERDGSVVGFRHPSIDEEQFVIKQVRLAGMLGI